jgi:hypothetical protein
LQSPNVFIHLDGGGIEARVADLGLATFLGRSCRSMAVDNPTWSAPEVIRGDYISEKADVFSLAIVMWELLTERFPYDDLMAEYGFTSKLCDAITSWKVRPTITAADRSDPEVPGFARALLGAGKRGPAFRFRVAAPCVGHAELSARGAVVAGSVGIGAAGRCALLEPRPVAAVRQRVAAVCVLHERKAV